MDVQAILTHLRGEAGEKLVVVFTDTEILTVTGVRSTQQGVVLETAPEPSFDDDEPGIDLLQTVAELSSVVAELYGRMGTIETAIRDAIERSQAGE